MARIADSERAKVELTWRRDIARVDETENLRSFLAHAEKENTIEVWQVAADALEVQGFQVHAQQIRSWLAQIVVLSVAEVDAVLTARGVDAKTFWEEAAGGDKVPLTLADIERIQETL